MRLVTVSGPPSAGKTSILLRTIQALKQEKLQAGVIKLDCLSTQDHLLYQKKDIPVQVGLSGNLCPDHFFVSNIEEIFQWGRKNQLDFLITESAGLCNRCSPHLKDILAVCVIDNLSGINTPKKIGPMLKMADIVVITKGDIVSQGEREVFSFRVREANPKALIIQVNGITGQGAPELASLLKESSPVTTLEGKRLRFSMPAALCSYCLGETKLGQDFQMGNVKKMQLD